MDDELIDSSGLSLARRSLLPGTGFFYPDSLDEEYADRRTREAVEGAGVVVVADADADGLGCVALLREAYDAGLDVAAYEADVAARLADDGGLVRRRGRVDEDEEGDERADADDGRSAEDESPVALVPAGPYNLDDALERVAAHLEPGADVFVCDIAPDEWEPIADAVTEIVNRADAVRWYDHHRWNDEVARAVEAAGIDLVVGDSDEECSTDVTLRSLAFDFDERFRELAAVTRDHDLWLREDPRSDDLADYAYWVDADEYVTVVGAYGADLPEPVEEYIARRRIEKEQLIERAVGRAEFHQVGEWTVGVTYGRCSQNEVAETLRGRGADAAVIVKPAGSASIRGSEGFERCHEVAALVDGGGHPKAAGCKPDIYDDMLDYAHHWTTEGSAARRVILAAFERIAERVENAEDGGRERDDVGITAAARGQSRADDEAAIDEDLDDEGGNDEDEGIETER